VLVLPPQFVGQMNLKKEQLLFAVELSKKFPKILHESDALKSATVLADEALRGMGQKYFGLCAEFRSAKLNRRESTLLLVALGYNKVRISEILRVSEVDDAIWDKYAKNEIGFKATLALGRGTDGAEEGDGEEEAEKPEKKKKKTRNLPKEYKDYFIKGIEDFGDTLKAGSDPYLFTYEDKEKRSYRDLRNPRLRRRNFGKRGWRPVHGPPTLPATRL